MSTLVHQRRAEQLLEHAKEFYFKLSWSRGNYLQFTFTTDRGLHCYAAQCLDDLIYSLAMEIWRRLPEYEVRLAAKKLLKARIALFREIQSASDAPGLSSRPDRNGEGNES